MPEKGVNVADALVPGFVEAVMRAGGKRPNSDSLRMVGPSYAALCASAQEHPESPESLHKGKFT